MLCQDEVSVRVNDWDPKRVTSPGPWKLLGKPLLSLHLYVWRCIQWRPWAPASNDSVSSGCSQKSVLSLHQLNRELVVTVHSVHRLVLQLYQQLANKEWEHVSAQRTYPDNAHPSMNERMIHEHVWVKVTAEKRLSSSDICVWGRGHRRQGFGTRDDKH